MHNLAYNESRLLALALEYEEGHSRRTRHILSVYGISNSLGRGYGLSEEAFMF